MADLSAILAGGNGITLTDDGTNITLATFSGGPTDVRKFGVSASATSDQLSAFQDAVDSGEALWIPPHSDGGYRLDGTLDLTAGGVVLRGAGAKRTALLGLDLTAPMVTLAGAYADIGGFFIGYDTAAAATDTAAIVFKVTGADFTQNKLSCIRVYNAYQAFATASTHGQFANSYDTLSISTCWGGALHLDPGSSTAQTPSHWRNIYISGLQTDGSTKIPLTTHPVILVANDDGQVFDALHIEDYEIAVGNSTPYLIQSSGSVGAKFRGVHFETNKLSVFNSVCMYVAGSGSAAVIEGLRLQRIEIANAAYVTRVAGDGAFTLNGLAETETSFSNGKTAADFNLVNNGSSNPVPYAFQNMQFSNLTDNS